MFWTITTELYLKNMKCKILWSTKHSLAHKTLDVELGTIMDMTRLPKPRVFVAGSCPRVNILHISAGRIPRDGFWVSWSPKWPVFIDSECPVCVWRDVDGWWVWGGGALSHRFIEMFVSDAQLIALYCCHFKSRICLISIPLSFSLNIILLFYLILNNILVKIYKKWFNTVILFHVLTTSEVSIINWKIVLFIIVYKFVFTSYFYKLSPW